MIHGVRIYQFAGSRKNKPVMRKISTHRLFRAWRRGPDRLDFGVAELFAAES